MSRTGSVGHTHRERWARRLASRGKPIRAAEFGGSSVSPRQRLLPQGPSLRVGLNPRDTAPRGAPEPTTQEPDIGLDDAPRLLLPGERPAQEPTAFHLPYPLRTEADFRQAAGGGEEGGEQQIPSGISPLSHLSIQA